MVEFEDLSLKQLREIVVKYNAHHRIKDFSKLKKKELIVEMKKHLKIENDMIKSVMVPYEEIVPETRKQKDFNAKVLYDIKRRPDVLAGLTESAREYFEKYAKKPRKPTKAQQEKVEYFIETSGQIKDKEPKKSRTKSNKIEEEEKIPEPEDLLKKAYEILERKQEDVKLWNQKLRGKGSADALITKELKKYSVASLKELIRKYNLHTKIKMTQKKNGLINDITKHLDFDGHKFTSKTFNIKKETAEIKKEETKREPEEDDEDEPILYLSSPTGPIYFQTRGDPDELDEIGKFILEKMKDVDHKIFVLKHKTKKDAKKTEYQKYLGLLAKHIQYNDNNLGEIWGRGDLNVARSLLRYDYDIFNFSKEDGKAVLRSIACVSQDDDSLEIKILSGSGYTYRIFEYIKNVVVNKGGIDKEFDINWKDIRYLHLGAIPTLNTLMFYEKQGMDIEKDANNDIINYLREAFETYKKGDIKEVKELLKDPVNVKLLEKKLSESKLRSLSPGLPELYLLFKGKEPHEELKEYVENKMETKLVKLDIIDDIRRGIKNVEGKGKSSGYALHTVLINKSIPFEQAQKEAQHIIKKKKFFHRETKNQYRFRNIPKQKFEPKTFKSKKANKDITLVFGQLKPEHMHLEGSGFLDWVKEKASNVASSVGNFLKPRLDDYNNKSKKTIEQYGNVPVKQLFISRTPVGGMLNNLINFISFGKWDELKKKYAFDKLFHLSLVARLSNGKDIILEKNEVVNISPEYKVYKDTENLDIPFSGQMTINKILETARKNVGDKTFFDYDAFNNGQATNCQGFIKLLLEGQNLYTESAKKFLFQDLESIYKDLPSYVPYIMKGATRLGNIVNKVTGGDKDVISMNKEEFVREHKNLINLLRKFKEPELLQEADKQADELKKIAGVEMSGTGKKKKIYN